MIRRLSLVLTATLCSLCASAQSLPSGLNLTARHSHFDLNTGETVTSGDARLAHGSALLQADEIRYNTRTKTAIARGNVVLTREGQRLLADELTYRVEEGTFTVDALRFGAPPLFLSAASATGGPDEVVFNDTRFSFTEPDTWSPTIATDRVAYSIADERLDLDRGRFGVGAAQPVPLPGQELPVDLALLSYLTARAGYSGSLGAHAGLGVHLPLLPGARLGGDVDFYTNRGLLIGPSGSYQTGTDEQGSRGFFNTGYIHDNGDKLTDVLGERIGADRGYVAWEHRQRFNESLTLAGQLNYWSDSEVMRDFRPEAFFPVQTPDTYLETTYAGENVVVSLFARAQPNTYHRVQQRLPEVRLDLLPTPIGYGLYERAQLSAAVLREDALVDGPTLRSDRYDAYYALSRPITPREWLAITPVAGGRVTHYARATGGRDHYTRTLGEIGFDAELRASGLYHYKNERWGIDGLRHLVTPTVSYRYIPKADRGRSYIPQIDDQVFSTYLQPLGLGDRRNIDELTDTNTLRLGVGNRLQTRDKTYGSRDLARLDVAADVEFDHERTGSTVPAVHTDFALMPVRWLQFEVYQSFAPENLRLREFNTGLVLRDGDKWALRLASHYLDRAAGTEEPIQEYVAGYRYRVNEVYSLTARLHFDQRQRRFVEQSYGLEQILQNLWTVRYELAFYEGPRRESSFGFNVALGLATF
ncbi:MAG TPA: LPS assembly protein LptD [Opitutaceae bacterium]